MSHYSGVEDFGKLQNAIKKNKTGISYQHHQTPVCKALWEKAAKIIIAKLFLCPTHHRRQYEPSALRHDQCCSVGQWIVHYTDFSYVPNISSNLNSSMGKTRIISLIHVPVWWSATLWCYHQYCVVRNYWAMWIQTSMQLPQRCNSSADVCIFIKYVSAMMAAAGGPQPASPLILDSAMAQCSAASQLLSAPHARQRKLNRSCCSVLGARELLGLQTRSNLQG